MYSFVDLKVHKHRQSCFAFSPYDDLDKFHTFSAVPKKTRAFEVGRRFIDDLHCRIYVSTPSYVRSSAMFEPFVIYQFSLICHFTSLKANKTRAENVQFSLM